MIDAILARIRAAETAVFLGFGFYKRTSLDRTKRANQNQLDRRDRLWLIGQREVRRWRQERLAMGRG